DRGPRHGAPRCPPRPAARGRRAVQRLHPTVSDVSTTPPVLGLPESSDALNARLVAGLERVERLIDERARNEDEFITEANLHLARAGGKRFRPMLTMLVAELGEGITD